ncbi:MAG: hypothetical protein OXI40_10695 [Chloroflexota bacterium]|nr:hypothetical protein [Chloroflexota bacterium]
MSESTDAILRRAHELIENDQLEQAEELLAPLLETEGNNPALWWVYAHAVSDSVIGVAALDRVLQLDPAYPGARELKAEALSAQGALAGDLDSQLDLASAQSSLVAEAEIDDWESIKPAVEDASTNPRAGRGFVLIIVALLILASGAVLVLSGAIDIDEILSLFTQPTNEPIIVVVAPTVEATETDLPSQPESTDEATVAASVISPTATGGLTSEPTSDPTSEPTAETVAETEPTAAPVLSATAAPVLSATAAPTLSATAAPALSATAAPALSVTAAPALSATAAPALSATAAPTLSTTEAPTLPAAEVERLIDLVGEQITDFSIDASRSAARQSELGMTFDILVCAEPGPEFNVRLQAVMNAAASVSDSIPARIEAFAVSLLNCADPNASVRTIGVARSVLDDFAAEAIDEKAFQRAWRTLA